MNDRNSYKQLGIEEMLFWKILINIQKIIMFLASIFIVLIMCVVILLRYVFKTDLYGMEEIIVMVGIWMYFIGSSYASYTKSQIKTDILSTYLKNEKHKRILQIITSLIIVSICAIFTYWAFGLIKWGIEMNPKSVIYRIPIVIPQSSIFFGFLLMTFYSSIHLIIDIKQYQLLKKEGQKKMVG